MRLSGFGVEREGERVRAIRTGPGKTAGAKTQRFTMPFRNVGSIEVGA